ncbi:MAG: hypothetical protein COA96_02660 [SAR86 cluster bacterium]|uniref:HD-GYP domain-containing protein n=1 Tax=SAR86 cluster bacterium TaxID=2030880 RepID=A0A2A5B9H3_9GAMM|nr:MAG: hypothetical protein COA96_02660 [SAR86 cluster bacterium]
MEISKFKNSPNRLASNSVLKVKHSDILLGMFICELDRPWSQTPFPVGGFHLRTAEDIEGIAKFCKFVFIDTNKGALPRTEKLNQLTILSSARRAVPASASLKIKRDTYPVSHSVKQQIDSAHKLYSNLKQEFYSQAQEVRSGKEMDLSCFSKSIDGLIEAIVANPQTLIWILNTDTDDCSETAYCVRASVWATILARQIGMRKSDMHTLFLGTLLADIGMQLLPERLVNKRGPFRRKEFLAYRKHVELGLQVVAKYPQLDGRVASIIRCHHERHDGLGFPRALRGEQIPVLARFANLAYCFERLLKSDSKGSPTSALNRLYKQRVLKFPEQLIVEFIHVMGMYSIGSLVELSSGEVALVLEQNQVQKLSPKIAILTDKNKSPLNSCEIVELGNEKDKLVRSIRSSFTNNESEKNSRQGKVLDPANYTFSFCGKRIGIGSIGLRF